MCLLLGELDLGVRPLELQLRYPLDRRTGEERAVAYEPQPASSRRLRGRVDRLRRPGCGRQGSQLADLAERYAAEGDRRHFLEDGGRVRRDLDAEALGELRGPRELVGRGRDHGAAAALGAAFGGGGWCVRRGGAGG